MIKINLLHMPFARLSNYPLGLFQLKYVVEKQLGSKVKLNILYPAHDLGKELGVTLNDIIFEVHSTGLGDWFFRQVAFPHLPDNTEEYFQQYFTDLTEEESQLKKILLEKRPGMHDFLESLIQNYQLHSADITGFSSLFGQNTASFALADRIKKLNPDAILVMGGANCQFPMGAEIVKNINAIDYVFSGQALKSFPAFIGHVIKGNLEACDHINGVYSKTNVSLLYNGSINLMGDERDINEDMELDYESFLDFIEERFPGKEVEPNLQFETSRGCWWGEKIKCKFCGMDKNELKYQPMSSEKALDLFNSMLKYQDRVKLLESVDLALPKDYTSELFPKIKTPADISIFYRVRCQFKEEDFPVLKKARINRILPGIESLYTPWLKLMAKGITAFHNIIYLKNSMLNGILTAWALLIGFPGEDEEGYEKLVKDIPRLLHLQPPVDVTAIRFIRYTHYFDNPRKYGLDLKPKDFYKLIYPFEEETIKNLAYFFENHNKDAPFEENIKKWQPRLDELRSYWTDRYYGEDGKTAAKLYVKSRGKQSVIYDSRSGEEKEHRLDEMEMKVLEALKNKKSSTEISREFGHIPGFDSVEILNRLQEKDFLFSENMAYTSLVLEKEPTLYRLSEERIRRFLRRSD